MPPRSAPTSQRMTGPARALCYRLAVATGLRYSEIGQSDPRVVRLEGPQRDRGRRLHEERPDRHAALAGTWRTTWPPSWPRWPRAPIFPLPAEKGAKMLRVDLEAAGIPYRDASGLVFDFHSLRCQSATLADAAGVSPRVVQKMMRHSTLELTGRYTRPRAVDIEAAAGMLPSLKPSRRPARGVVMTGTDPSPGFRKANC